MSPYAELPCWVIMNCADNSRCPAKEQPHRDCWEIFSEFDRKAFNICQDCLVYLSRQEESILSRNEMDQIMLAKGIDINSLSADPASSPES
ncbi:MAG: hypothetical protein KJO60_06325 [Desulfofustis sp.]|nr:hypothetical protein [Desulfofustis sp.]MBT8354117.1 hypothetical protein [Desulfofustis sp.]NNF45188.1 hypothetical protein [Desulfofustis sp.]NNK58409.1 hypothetical protein [Desulfofustis sp.]